VDYLQLMKSIFDFDVIRKLIQGSNNKAPFNILIDSMNGGKNIKHVNWHDFNQIDLLYFSIISLYFYS